MTITAEQITAISAELSVDLATVTDDRLIELCLLYRSAPEALPTFPALLEEEITRRFTAAEIAANDVMFSVIQNFSNQFNPLVGYQDKFYKLAVTDIDQRDNWFGNNATFFYDVLHSTEPLAWLVTNPEIMSYAAASSTAMTAVAASSIAMTAVAASSVAMTLIVASSVALSAIVKSTPARNALMASNTVFQNNRVAIYNTVKARWTKQAGIADSSGVNSPMPNINNAVANPAGFVFASLGFYTGGALSNIAHPNGTLAAAKGTSNYPSTLANLDAVSFNGAAFKSTIANAQAYAELWIPPA